MQKYLFKNIQVVNEGKIETKDVLTEGERIGRIDDSISPKGNFTEIIGDDLHLLPGCIDDQVHFREPGLTHKATISSESRAAVAGGITSFMEMPNTIPNALTLNLLENKYSIAAKHSVANYSFFMGVSNNNKEEVLKINRFKNSVCGIKIFMGSSTGDMLVDNYNTLNAIFENSELLIATHCEDEKIIRENYRRIKNDKQDLEPSDHPVIRNSEACFESSLSAIQLAKKYDSRLHILHISTEKELQLFSNMLPLSQKRITAEVCVHHLHFTDNDYKTSGYNIKCNPAIKTMQDREALWKALLDDKLDVIATDHAPHLPEEKLPPYEKAHSGLPLVQHSLLLMLYYYKQGKISLEQIARKMSHAVADCFLISERGYIREGYFADLVVADLNNGIKVQKENLLYKCKWSPLESFEFPCSIHSTYVNGNKVYGNGSTIASSQGMRLMFNR